MASRPRRTRLFTVESGVRVTSAISSSFMPFFEAQRQRLPVQRRQRVHGGGQDRGALAGQHRAQRIRRRRRKCKLVVFQALRRAPAQQIHRGVVRDGEEPRIEAARRIVAVELADHMQPGLLEQVVGRGLVAHQAQEVAIEPVLVLADSLRQRRRVAAAQACDLGSGSATGKLSSIAAS